MIRLDAGVHPPPFSLLLPSSHLLPHQLYVQLFLLLLLLLSRHSGTSHKTTTELLLELLNTLRVIDAVPPFPLERILDKTTFWKNGGRKTKGAFEEDGCQTADAVYD